MTSTNADDLRQARQALLRQRLRGAPRAATVAPVTRRADTAPAPLSVSQRQLWYLSQLAPESLAYNEMVTVRKTGHLDVDALRRALTEIVRRHQAWRTSFPLIDGEPRQLVHAPTSVELPVLDLTELPFPEAEQRATKLGAQDTRRPYELTKGPLLRPRLVSLTPTDHRLYLGLHHLIFDGVTLYRIVLPELVRLYDAYAAGAASPLAEPEVQYPDYAAWEIDWVAGPDVGARIERWQERLSGVAPLGLPLEHPRPQRQSFAGGTVPLCIEAATVRRLRDTGGARGASLFHVLAAAYSWWLHCYTGTDDITFATMGDLRQRPELAGMAGYCLAPVVIRTDTGKDPSLLDLLARVRDGVLDGLGDIVPFEILVRELGIVREPRMNPVFQATLVLEPPMESPDPAWSIHQMESAIGAAVGSAKFDLSIELDERPDGHVAGRLIYSSSLFARSSAEQMTRHWTRMLEAVSREPDARLSALALVDEGERHRQTDRDPTAPEAVPERRCVHELIAAQAAHTPDAIAVVAGEDQLTYRELEQRATAAAGRLRAAGVGPGAVVATVLDRNLDLVVGLLGVLKSGAAYLPINPQHPARRTEFMLHDAGARWILTSPTLLPQLPTTAANVITLDGSAPSTPEDSLPATGAGLDDLAYVIYTSGSTGTPKGVLVEHRNLTHLTWALCARLGITAADTVLTVAAYTFDMSVGDIFGTLRQGGRLVLASTEQASDPRALGPLIDRSGATYLSATPTTWSALLSSGWDGNSRLTARSGGEPLPEALAERLLQHCAGLWNSYGPTETTDVASCADIVAGDPITVGRPLPGTWVYVLDTQRRLLPPGVPGELVIGGAGVARGYLNRPVETAERFRADPFVEHGLAYWTGDRGRVLADGRIQHLGRYDEQVKIRGFRIEPAEVAAVLGEHPEITSCVVVARELETGEKQLVAYAVGTALPNTALRSWLRGRLPDYMVPGAIVHLRALPMTDSGKVDRAALLPPVAERTAQGAGLAPCTPTEERLAALWSAALNAEVTDVRADFFDLGGHSLLAARLISDTSTEFRRDVQLVDFIERGTTIAGLAALLDEEAPTAASPASSADPLFFVYPDHVSAVSVRHLVHAWGAQQPVHPVVPAQPDGFFAPGSTVEGLVRVLIQEIRNTQPHGPYALAGFSLGGLLAYEIARQLSAAGEHVEWLSLLDSPSPTTADLLLRQMSPWQRLKGLRRQSGQHQWAKLREVAVRSIRKGPNAPSPEEHFDMRGALQIARRYGQLGHKLPIKLFATADSVRVVDDEALGWGDYHSGRLSLHALPGDHDTLLDQPQVDDVAQLLLGSLQHSRAARATPSDENRRTARPR